MYDTFYLVFLKLRVSAGADADFLLYYIVSHGSFIVNCRDLSSPQGGSQSLLVTDSNPLALAESCQNKQD